ncbi:16S rRNA (guanine(966)-N(2))-methyltransferase RsmD [Larsenimonas rhizosphaerae]|uniref:16S rRNA (guanine(966)-N(2))-methyltransferase RsmD n=1 Tax=Larsenimonas rhizosphaerae TaxID=2944682 RepID=UPI00203499FF|nr:16S rRNA (guanine(966)-N(2))-methyltransferase RsmD [Larsenimonas rhizosphaerae]MCM2131675.1 16S rRNA (guanine(966)-N(2))-methyltransferase RsmD [Larsenimonas rhizosphaerae]
MTRRRPPTSSSRTKRPPGKLRLIGGIHRRRQLPVPDRPGLRPTPDRVRETLFNWLGSSVHGARVLDAFAGTGALGLEALSRGATTLSFIEQDRIAADQLADNLATLSATATLLRQDALIALATAPAAPFDIIFLDPPFNRDLAAPSCSLLEQQGWLASEAWIYLETEATLLPEVPATWRLHREARAGESHARLYRRSALAET